MLHDSVACPSCSRLNFSALLARCFSTPDSDPTRLSALTALQRVPSAGVGIFRPARPGRHHRISSSLSPSWSRTCCNTLRPATLLPARRPVAAAHRPGRRPSAPILLALPACRLARGSSPARAASLPAGPARFSCPRCQPVGWPCAFLAGSRAGPHPLRVSFTVRALAGLLASSSHPRRPTGGLEFHRFRSFQGFAFAQGG